MVNTREPAVFVRTDISFSYMSQECMVIPTNDICAEQRLRPAWASVQSDLSLRWSHE